MKKRDIKSLNVFCMLCCIFLVQGCIRDDSGIVSRPGGSQEVIMIVEIPELQAPPTRSMEGAKESYVNEADVLVFDVDDSDPANVAETFREHARGNIVGNSGTGQAYKVELKAKLTAGSGCRVVIVANAGAQVASAISGLAAGTPKKTVLELLRYASGPWAANGAGDTFQSIPMYGETGVVNIGFGKKFEGIQLRRMVARIDVINQAPAFTMGKIYLCNYNTIGYIAPKWRANDGQIVPVQGAPNLPSDPGRQPGAAVFIPPGQSFTGEIYTQEAAAADDVGETARRNATCLVIEGIYDGEKNFYRVDFTYDTTAEGQPVRYMPLLRNYKYRVSIISAAGRGYATFEEALAAYTVPSNLKTRTLSYDMGMIKEVVFNGQYMLGVSKNTWSLPSLETNTPQETYELSVFTDYPGGWEVVKIEDEADGGPASWLTLSATGGPGGTITDIYPFIGNNGDSPRSARITLKAGRLTLEIRAVQSPFPPVAE